MHSRNHALPSILFFTVIVSTLFPTSARAEDHPFKATIVYRFVSAQVIGDELIIETEGAGVSRLLGPVIVTGTVVQTRVPGDCDPTVGQFTFYVEGGTIEIRSEGFVCPPPTKISDMWFAEGGTGEFAGVTGSGTSSGVASRTGRDPVIVHYEGMLSY